MLREIIAITGKPGLYRILTQGKGSIIVEQLGTSHRFPVLAREKVVSLGDIAMYTESGDTPLGEILDKVYAHNQGNPIDVKKLADTKGALKKEFGEVVEDFDRDRVHDSDIKKLFSWYNILIDNGFETFTEKEEEAGESDAEPETPAEK